MLAYSGAKVQSHFYPGDLVTRRTGDRESWHLCCYAALLQRLVTEFEFLLQKF